MPYIFVFFAPIFNNSDSVIPNVTISLSLTHHARHTREQLCYADFFSIDKRGEV